MLRTCVTVLAMAPGALMAQDGADLRFTLGLGVGASPDYFGADSYSLGPAGSFSIGYARLGGLEFGRLDGARTEGLAVTGAFRFVPERSAADNPELTGLSDVDLTAEAGLGLAYRGPNYEVFANARYGFFGHEAIVGTVGADYIVRPDDRWTFRAGPRVEIGSDEFADTYFGVTAAESGASGLAEYDPSGGIYAAGIEVGAEYRMTPEWSVEGIARYSRLTGDAKDSPITGLGDDSQSSVSVVLKRTFTLGF